MSLLRLETSSGEFISAASINPESMPAIVTNEGRAFSQAGRFVNAQGEIYLYREVTCVALQEAERPK